MNSAISVLDQAADIDEQNAKVADSEDRDGDAVRLRAHAAELRQAIEHLRAVAG